MIITRLHRPMLKRRLDRAAEGERVDRAKHVAKREGVSEGSKAVRAELTEVLHVDERAHYVGVTPRPQQPIRRFYLRTEVPGEYSLFTFELAKMGAVPAQQVVNLHALEKGFEVRNRYAHPGENTVFCWHEWRPAGFEVVRLR